MYLTGKKVTNYHINEYNAGERHYYIKRAGQHQRTDSHSSGGFAHLTKRVLFLYNSWSYQNLVIGSQSPHFPEKVPQNQTVSLYKKAMFSENQTRS